MIRATIRVGTAVSSMEGAQTSHSNRRYILFAVFVAVLAILATILLTALVSAMGGDEAVRVRLDSPRIHRSEGRSDHSRHVNLVIAPVMTAKNDEAWEDLAHHLERALGVEVHLVRRGTFAEVDALIEGGDAVVALISGGPYVRLRREGVVRLLAVPQVNGVDDYRSHVIVPVDAKARSFDDLRGGTFAFSDPLSSAGTLYPRYLLAERGETAESFFARTVFTHGHQRSMRAVANGLIDGAAVDSISFDIMRAEHPEVIRRVRVVHSSPPLGPNAFVASQGTPTELAAALREQLLALDETEAGRAVLSELGVTAFVPGNPVAYRSIEAMLPVVGP